MATFQDARDGLDALLQDKGARLTTPEKDKHIVEAGRLYSRRRPRVIADEIAGDGGFTYVLPSDYIDGFSFGDASAGVPFSRFSSRSRGSACTIFVPMYAFIRILHTRPRGPLQFALLSLEC